jgi:hypothetical protein
MQASTLQDRKEADKSASSYFIQWGRFVSARRWYAMSVRPLGVGIGDSGAAITARDIDMLRYSTRHGVCTADQLTRRFFSSDSACWRRLRVLERLGLIVRRRTWWQGPQVVLATPLGSQLANVDLSPARLNLPELEHSLALVDLSEQLLLGQPGSQWLTERELRRDAIRRHRQDGMDFRPVRIRTPDGVLVLGAKRIAIELDLTPKRTEQYEQLLRAYAADRTVQGLWWFARSAAVCDRLTKLIDRYQLTDFALARSWTAPLRRPDLALEA